MLLPGCAIRPRRGEFVVLKGGNCWISSCVRDSKIKILLYIFSLPTDSVLPPKYSTQANEATPDTRLAGCFFVFKNLAYHPDFKLPAIRKFLSLKVALLTGLRIAIPYVYDPSYQGCPIGVTCHPILKQNSLIFCLMPQHMWQWRCQVAPFELSYSNHLKLFWPPCKK